MQIFINTCLLIYLSFYIFEGPIRYALGMAGADALIFVRDIVLIAPLVVVLFMRQFIEKKPQIAAIIFVAIIAVHGFISFANIGSVFVVLYSAKVLLSILAGVVLAEYLIEPNKRVIKILFIFWIVTCLGVFIDKYDIISYPWTGLETTIGDIKVDITKNWTVTGFDKRAGGLMRSSINVALVTPFLAFILLFATNSALLRLVIFVVTTLVLYWTTQKASIIAFAFTCILLASTYKYRLPAIKMAITFFLILMVALPLILPQYIMPNTKGMFSMSSFYMRAEDMWPQAWQWIESREVFPFGVGLGGIGGAQRFYSINSMNAADNMFVFLYAWFGLFSFLYMGFLWWVCIRPRRETKELMLALSILLFIIIYGVALSMIEDQMSSLFLGATIGFIAKESAKRKLWHNEEKYN